MLPMGWRGTVAASSNFSWSGAHPRRRIAAYLYTGETMLRVLRLLSAFVLFATLGAVGQQAQPSTPQSPPPVVHHHAAHKPKRPVASGDAAIAPAQPAPNLSNDNHYTNSSGVSVHSPARASSVPSGASAVCGDGTYSFSQHRQGTCSHHGGVSRWL